MGLSNFLIILVVVMKTTQQSIGVPLNVPAAPVLTIDDLNNSPLNFETGFGAINVSDEYFEEVEESCVSTRKKVFPQQLVNVNNMTKTVLNYGKFKQGINAEICSNLMLTCGPQRSYQNNQKSICIQKYTNIPLKIINEDGTIVDDYFPYPSHCVCELVTMRKPFRRQKSLAKSV